MKYWAFISYSHKDTAIADWLHRKLETYRVPKSLVGTPSREGEVPSRIMPIFFRDREELPTSSELGDNLQKSLHQSRHLIVICSPDAAQSRWVEEEVRAFKGWHGRDHILALIGRGAPNATDRGRAEEECFPQSMRFDVNAANARVQVEPIAADLRPEGDGRERAFLKIVAGLLGVGFDDLYQREKRRQKRRQMMLAAAAILALACIAATWWSIARLGKSQKEMSHDLASVRQEAELLSTDYKDVHPSNKESEVRIRAAAQRAQEALDNVDGHTDTPDHEYALAVHAARNAVAAVAKEARTAEETIFAMELAKPLEARLLKVNNEYGNEIIRRKETSVPASALEKMRNPEPPK